MSFDKDHHAIILAGGLGTRLWPLSCRLEPKQFISVNAGVSLFEQTVDRILELFSRDRIWVIIKPCQRERFRDIPSILEENIIIEPEERGTAAAVCLGVAHIAASYPDAVLTVMPSDHLIEDAAVFRETIRDGAMWATRHGQMVLYGIKPSRPETAYGYIEAGSLVGELNGRVFRTIRNFHEKPDVKMAERYLKAGVFMWNSGIFTFPVSGFMDILGVCRKDMQKNTDEMIEALSAESGEEKGIYAKFDDSSIDMALIERIPEMWSEISVTPCDFSWHDMGIWETYFATSEKDEAGNVICEKNVGIDCVNTMLFSENSSTVIGAVGLEDMVVVARDNAVLVCPRDRLGEVGRIVNELEKKGMKDYI